MNPPTEQTTNPPVKRWCSIKSVANGWTAQTLDPVTDPGHDCRDDTFVFSTADTLAAWVREYFGGESEVGKQVRNPPACRIPPICPKCFPAAFLDAEGVCTNCGNSFGINLTNP